MDNTKPKLSKEQEKYREELMARGHAFDAMVKSEGFKYMKAYYENSLKQFVTDIFSDEKKTLSEYEERRQQLLGLKKLLTDIDFSIKAVYEQKTK